MITCPACGHEVSADDRFCSMCGERLAGFETTTTMGALDDQTLTNELSSEDIAAIDALPAGSALLMVLKGPGAGGRYLLRDDRVVAGRHPDSGIFLDDITVSRSHVGFTRDQGSFLAEDLGSLNGTYVNRELLKAPVLLRNGDEVQIGKYRMIFFLGSATGTQ
ncbi:MAG: FHA domain-containing protein [Propionibacteriaceae bacterium]|nr:FHA domain-containing protein [Propionibacteriaceae bacterium]